MDSRARILGRRLIVVAVVGAQVALLIRGLHADHKEFAFRMFPESSTWQADIVRVTASGERVPVDHNWPGGYHWADLVRGRGLDVPQVRHHADAGVANQLAFLHAAVDWVATHTPRDHVTRYVEADVTYWRNTRPARSVVFRSHLRP